MSPRSFRRNDTWQSRYFFGLGKMFYVCRVCIHDHSFNDFENDTMTLSYNEAKIDWFVSKELHYYSTGFDFKICLRAEIVNGHFEKRSQAPKSSNK